MRSIAAQGVAELHGDETPAMTPTNQSSGEAIMKEVEVTQADRDAAAHYWALIRPAKIAYANNIEAGKLDASSLVQMLAKHRLAATSQPEAGECDRMRAREEWFKRHANRAEPKAFINVDPEYFASECADAITQAREALAAWDSYQPYITTSGVVDQGNALAACLRAIFTPASDETPTLPSTPTQEADNGAE